MCAMSNVCQKKARPQKDGCPDGCYARFRNGAPPLNGGCGFRQGGNSSGTAFPAYPLAYLDVAPRHCGLLRPVVCPGISGRGGRQHRQVRTRGLVRQCHPVLHCPAVVSLGARAEPHSCVKQDDASRADGALHQEQCRHVARHDGYCRATSGHQSKDSPFRIAPLYYDQYERLCGLHPRHLTLCHAKWRDSIDASHHSALDPHLRHLCHRQCRRTDGLLFPHALADVWHRRTSRHPWHHPTHLYHHRHG